MSTDSHATPHGVIHDIGFRHYDGPRLGRGWAFRSLLWETVRGAYGLGRPAKAKVMPWLLLSFFMVPALVIVIIAIVTGDKSLTVTFTQYPLTVSLLITLFAAGRAPYAVSRDLRDGVIPLYLSRPITRRDYVLAKYVGLWIAIFIFIAAPITLMMVGSLLAKMSVDDTLLGWLGGLLMGAMLSALIAAIALTIAAFTKRRGLGVAAILTILIIATGMAAIIVDTVGFQVSHEAGSYGALMEPYMLIDGIGASLLGVEPLNTSVEPVNALGTTVFIAWYLTIIGGALAILFKRYKKVGGV